MIRVTVTVDFVDRALPVPVMCEPVTVKDLSDLYPLLQKLFELKESQKKPASATPANPHEDWLRAMGLGPNAIAVLNWMANGARLRVPLGPGDFELVKDGQRVQFVSGLYFIELRNSGLICKMTRWGENGCPGWEQLGLDGTNADWYRCTQ